MVYRGKMVLLCIRAIHDLCMMGLITQKLQAINKNYNDRSFGGANNGFTVQDFIFF